MVGDKPFHVFNVSTLFCKGVGFGFAACAGAWVKGCSETEVVPYAKNICWELFFDGPMYRKSV